MLFKPEFYRLESKPPQVCISEGVSHPISFLAFVTTLIMPVWEAVVPVSQAITQYCYSTKDNVYFYYMNIFHIQGAKYFYASFIGNRLGRDGQPSQWMGYQYKKKKYLQNFAKWQAQKLKRSTTRVNALKESNLWKGKSHLSDWFETTWLKEHKVSASRRQKMFIANI